ncbi:MAG TPA: hypothetical protein VFU78_03685, partial [Thermomicrobiales bacterium]|nr:hypothetical protein [Thermomicrobiales bacterium]
MPLSCRAIAASFLAPWRCVTIPLPWGLLTLGLLILIPGDALYRVLLPPASAKSAHLLAFGDRLLLR